MISAQATEVFFHVLRYLFFFLPYSLSYFSTLHGEQQGGLVMEQSDLLGVPSNKLPQKEGIPSQEGLHLNVILHKARAPRPWANSISRTPFNTWAYRLLAQTTLMLTPWHGSTVREQGPFEAQPTASHRCATLYVSAVLHQLLLTKTFVQHEAWEDFTPHVVKLPSLLRSNAFSRSFS